MISFYDWAPTQQSGQAGENHRFVESPEAQKDEELQKAICQRIQDAVDISDVFNKVAIHAGKTSPKTLVYAVHRIARYCRLRRQDIGPTRRAARFLSLLESLQRNLAQLDAQALTDLSWSLAVLNHRDNKILAGLCHQLFARVEEFSPANLAISAWSFATLNYRDDLVMKRLNRQALGRLQDFEAQSLANLSWAEATMRFKDDVLMHHIAGEALRKMDRFSPQHVANTAWAYATLGRRADALFKALEARALQLLQEDAPDFVSLDLALCSWSFAWLEHVGPNSPLLHAIADASLRRLGEFSTQQLANMLWGLDHANYQNSRFFETVVQWCCSRPMSFWQKAAGEEMVSVMTALRPYASGDAQWRELEAFFTNETLRPLARFLCTSNSSDGYVQGLRQLRTYHAGALYTSWLFEQIGRSRTRSPRRVRTGTGSPADSHTLHDSELDGESMEEFGALGDTQIDEEPSTARFRGLRAGDHIDLSFAETQVVEDFAPPTPEAVAEAEVQEAQMVDTQPEGLVASQDSKASAVSWGDSGDADTAAGGRKCTEESLRGT